MQLGGVGLWSIHDHEVIAIDQFRLVGLTENIHDFMAGLAHDTSSIAA